MCPNASNDATLYKILMTVLLVTKYLKQKNNQNYICFFFFLNNK